MSTIVVPALNRLKLGRMLCQFRERSGLTQELAAADLDMSDSSLSRNEKGQIAPHPLAVRAMLELYYVPRDGWDDVLELAREAKRGAWWQVLGISAQAYVALESEAIAIRNFELAFIPGLLQTEEYACEVFTLDDARRRSRSLAIRMNRQERLHADEPLRLHTIIDETALIRPIGTERVHYDQLRHVAAMAELLKITVQVLPQPIGVSVGMRGAFNVLSFPPDTIDDVGYVDHAAG
ncbi:MAG TPA: helix-turn-helix transcriptional regulator, partial [Pseudonocardiaceae bacterium]|nr:helix-turn-helix transcriptional regulator [Pseudonocardiaceae bacterium]